MNVELLSRLQFAVATYFHFLFVPLTLGLSFLVAIIETIYVRTGDEKYKVMAKFWGKLFLINFAVGVVTGITLEFQFGTNWSKYSEYVGDIFGSLLAIEATVAFFLESTFIAVWFFGWEKLSKKVHLLAIWLVAIASNMSAFWILAANAWMQHPVGYTIRNGRAELTDFLAVITSKFAVLEFLHTSVAAYILSGFFMMGVSAYHLLKKQHLDFFKRSFQIGLIFAFIFSIFGLVTGHFSGSEVAEVQPSKLAAMESIWETRHGAPIYVVLIPDEENQRNLVEWFPIPNLLSIMAYHYPPDAKVQGLLDFPANERPPVTITFYSFRLMVFLGTLFIALTSFGMLIRKRLLDFPWYLKIMLFSIPLPYIAAEVGWTVAEVGRQPWIVYGLMKTSEGVSNIQTHQVLISLIGFTVIYAFLGFVDFYLLAKYARKGPKPLEKEDPDLSGEVK